MITANPGWIALFNGDPHPFTERVEAWDDQGRALVIDRGIHGGRLVPAVERPGFDHVDHSDNLGEHTAVAALPGGGWQVEYRNDDGSTSRSEVIAWSVDREGDAYPLTPDRSGPFGVHELSRGTARLVPPAEATGTEV